MAEVTSYRQGVPNWVDVSTSDIPGTTAFYATLFGWEAEDQGEEAGHYTMLRKGGLDVAGLGPNFTGAPPAWLVYLAVDDVDAAAAAVTAAGGTVLMPPDTIFDAGRMAVAMDPSGAVHGMWQAKQHIGSRLVNEPGAPVWHELNTRDPKAATAYYGAVVGATYAPMDPADPHGYQLMQIAGRSVGGLMPMEGDEWGDMPSHWMPSFAVADPDAIAEKAASLGGSVGVPPQDIPVGRFAVLADPTGAHFSIIRLNAIDDPNQGWTA
jgi:uncharacterized protein